MMIITASYTNSVVGMGGSGRVEVFGVPIVLPAGSGPEKGLVSDFINHFECLILTRIIYFF